MKDVQRQKTEERKKKREGGERPSIAPAPDRTTGTHRQTIRPSEDNTSRTERRHRYTRDF